MLAKASRNIPDSQTEKRVSSTVIWKCSRQIQGGQFIGTSLYYPQNYSVAVDLILYSEVVGSTSLEYNSYCMPILSSI